MPCSAARPARGARSSVLNAGAALFVGGRASASFEEGVRIAEEAIDSGAALDALERFVAKTRELARAPEEAVERARRDHARGARRRSSAGASRSRSQELERAISARREGRPFNEALARPGISRDRRVQAALAGRRRPAARRGPVEEIVRAYERGGAAALSVLTESDHFGGSLADLRAARAAHATCRSCARTSRSTATSSTRRRPRGADAVLLIVAALEPRGARAPARGGARRSTSTAWSRCTTPRSSRPRSTIDAEVIGINNRDLRRLRVDVRARSSCSPTCPPARPSSPRAASARAARSRSSSGSAWTPC